jgi:YfiH family protein
MSPTALQFAVAQRRKRAISHCPEPTPHNWQELTVGALRILQVPAFARIPWLVHGFSTRLDGASLLNGEKILNLGFTAWDSSKNVLENRRRFQSAVVHFAGIDSKFSLMALKQIHSDLVRLVEDIPREPEHGDAAVTDRQGLLLAVQTADCVPILLVDPKKRAVAAIHAGWRGTLRRIVAKTVGHMRMHFGSKPADILAAIGPAIGGCCYEVGTEIAADFLSQFAEAPDFFEEFRTGDEPNPIQWLNQMPPGHQPPPKNVLLDLRKANASQLYKTGLNAKHVFVSNLCTACRPDLLFSYRRQGTNSGRQMAAIGISK